MTACQMAGRPPCPNPAVAVVRIADVGDRPLCQADIETLTRLGMSFRRLDDTAPLPAWRRRDLTKDMTRQLA